MRIAICLTILALLFAPLPIRAQEWPPLDRCPTVSGENVLAKRLEDILKKAPSLKGARYSIQFATAPDGKLVYENDPHRMLTPASVVKLITGAAALSYLGHEHSFPTEFYGNRSSDGTTIVGPLYAKGYGDPSLVSERLFLWAEALRSRGVESIEGDVVVDDTFFEDLRFNSAWAGAGSDESYVAATGALSVNFNALTLIVRPDRKPGQPTLATLEPRTDYVAIKNHAKTGKPGSSIQLAASRITQEGKRPRITLKGTIAVDTPEKRIYKNVSDPARYSGTLLKEFLERAGVSVRGHVRTGKVPEGVPLLEQIHSKPLALIVRDLNKYSNNFVAEQLVKALGATQREPPGTWENGLAVLGDFLRHIGAPNDKWKLLDGSGLSQDNRLSAATLVHVLMRVFQEPRLRPEYEASLSVGGADGTVRRRFKEAEVARRVRAKTGHLSGVSALAGYLYPTGMRPLAFAILVNGFRGGFPEVEADVDELVAEVLTACAQAEIQQELLPLLPETGPTRPTP